MGVRFLEHLTGGFLNVPPNEAIKVAIRTQVQTTDGRPDLELSWPDSLAVVEVKMESQLRKGQLEGYRILLRESGRPNTRLILLTRYLPAFAAEDEKPDLIVRWCQVAEWLNEECRREIITDEVVWFLCTQFVRFLEARNMAIAQVNWHMGEGVRAHRSLLDMLEEVIRACKASVRKSNSWDWIGFWLDSKYWIGVVFDDPEQLHFQTEGCRIDPQAANDLEVGMLVEPSSAPGGVMWRRTAELNSEEIHFYSRSRAGQVQWLEGFLQECLAMARTIETSNQSSSSDQQ